MLADYVRTEAVDWFRHTIWRGHHRETGAAVYGKVMAADDGDDPRFAAASFERLASLRHPCLPRVAWWGRTKDGSDCVITEAVEEPALAEQLGHGPWCPRKALEVAIATCAVLAWAEERISDTSNPGHIVTPHHVRVSADGARVKLLGLSAPWRRGALRVTQVGLVSPDGPAGSFAPESASKSIRCSSSAQPSWPWRSLGSSKNHCLDCVLGEMPSGVTRR